MSRDLPDPSNAALNPPADTSSSSLPSEKVIELKLLSLEKSFKVRMCEGDEMRVEQRKQNCIFKSKHPEIPRICSFLIYNGQA